MATFKTRTIFENDHFLVVDKPPGWLTIPARAVADPRPCVLTHLSQNQKLFVVHRLDEEVSGIIMLAKNINSHRTANLWFENRQVRKKYEALSEGDFEETKKFPVVFNWEIKMLRGKKRSYESDRGKETETKATCIGRIIWEKKRFLNWNLEPKTGRSHQLRVALSQHGFPIVGDTLYGSKDIFLSKAIALRAVELIFTSCPGAQKLGLPLMLNVENIKTYFNIK